MKGFIIFTSCAIAVSAIAVTSCSSSEQERQPPADQRQSVPVDRIYRGENGYTYVDKFCQEGRAVYVGVYMYHSTNVTVVDRAPECVK
jgi:hypothetical protein